jgi:hypothetical protein
MYNKLSVLDFSVDPPDRAAPECATGYPAVERGDWRGNFYSPKPCLHKTIEEYMWCSAYFEYQWSKNQTVCSPGNSPLPGNPNTSRIPLSRTPFSKEQ